MQILVELMLFDWQTHVAQIVQTLSQSPQLLAIAIRGAISNLGAVTGFAGLSGLAGIPPVAAPSVATAPTLVPVAGMPPSVTPSAAAPAPAPAPSSATSAAAAAATAAAREQARRRRRRSAALRGYGDEFMDVEVGPDWDVPQDEEPAAPTASDQGAANLGFAGTVHEDTAGAAAGLATLAGDRFDAGPREPMLPGTWEPDGPARH
ncbi:putative PPE family protein PPE3 [Mycobacterium pseudokansasii]|nr:putative PPE family protein PPE3 [Mycobacterium pseudokansasii]VAZ88948.1 putative PPE family protein PPE3 [Mycobacterium pseudokansasii]